MTSTVFTGGNVFDGTGADPAAADIRIDNGRITEIGVGLSGDEQIDVSGKTVFPGFFDCHVHFTVSDIDTLKRLNTPSRTGSTRPSTTCESPSTPASPACETQRVPTSA